MTSFTYRTRGTCSQAIRLELEGETIQSVEFIGGCPGNTLGITKLVKGKNAREVIDTLKGTRCGMKPTSCPDQLSKALEAALQA